MLLFAQIERFSELPYVEFFLNIILGHFDTTSASLLLGNVTRVGCQGLDGALHLVNFRKKGGGTPLNGFWRKELR